MAYPPYGRIKLSAVLTPPGSTARFTCSMRPPLMPLKVICRGMMLSKGAIRFQPDKPLPSALVHKLVKTRLAENAAASKKN